MNYIECPKVYEDNGKSLFIAGGISNCPNWQKYFSKLLKDVDITVLNPRRKNFDVNNMEMELDQILWEHNHLDKATAVSFWFPKETDCPITLYELGKNTVSGKKIFIGMDRKYSRRRDVEYQTRLERPEVEVVYSLEDLYEQIKEWAGNEK